MKATYKYVLVILAATLFITSCQKDTITDAEKLAALKDVNFTMKGVTFNVGLPANALNGQTFNELLTADSATFANPANYSINFLVKMLADNTKENANDAKFDGMLMKLIMDTLQGSPISTTASAFEILKNTTQEVLAQGTINLNTHKDAGLYIFQQIVDSQDLASTISTALNYNVGSLQGSFNLPSVQQQIPTVASAEMKSFLNGLIDSNVFGNAKKSSKK